MGNYNALINKSHSFKREVKEKFGVPPERLIELLAIAGDTADGVPGVSGLGEGKAAKVLTGFGSFEAAQQVASDEAADVVAEEALRKDRKARAENTGGWFTTKGDAACPNPSPTFTVVLHRASDAFASQIHAYQLFNSFANGNVSIVVVAAVAATPLEVVAERAHLLETPPLHSGGAFENALGEPLVLQMRRK
jgi:hypothetical protein